MGNKNKTKPTKIHFAFPLISRNSFSIQIFPECLLKQIINVNIYVKWWQMLLRKIEYAKGEHRIVGGRVNT